MSKSLTFEKIQKELRIDANGVGYCSIRGAARLAGVSDAALRKSFDSANLETSGLALTLTNKGFEGANLKQYATTGIPDLALATILEYYAMDAGRYCTEAAKAAYKAFAAVGIRVVIQQACGWSNQTQPAITLPPGDVRVANLTSALEKLDIDLSNPRFKQGLQDLTLDILGISSQPSLPGGDRWVGVAERAEQLGYSVTLVTRYRSQLGKAVKSQGLPSRSEARLCNGSQRPINLYLVSEELDRAIHAYLGSKVN